MNKMATTREMLFNKLAYLRRQRDEILIPIIKASIPKEVLDSFVKHPKYFKGCTAVKILNGSRSLVTNINQFLPSEDCIININVSTFVFDEVVSIDNRLEGVLKAITELK
jgi:hypothetical protein